MTKYEVRIGANNVGAIGARYWLKKTYIVEANSRDEMNMAAIKAAHADGLEHVLVESFRETKS